MSADIGKGDWVQPTVDMGEDAGPRRGSVWCVAAVQPALPGASCSCHGDRCAGGIRLVHDASLDAYPPEMGWCVLCFAKLGGPRQAEPRSDHFSIPAALIRRLYEDAGPYRVPEGFEVWGRTIPEDWFA